MTEKEKESLLNNDTKYEHYMHSLDEANLIYKGFLTQIQNYGYDFFKISEFCSSKNDLFYLNTFWNWVIKKNPTSHLKSENNLSL